jgi:hypothetical protein
MRDHKSLHECFRFLAVFTLMIVALLFLPGHSRQDEGTCWTSMPSDTPASSQALRGDSGPDGKRDTTLKRESACVGAVKASGCTPRIEHRSAGAS